MGLGDFLKNHACTIILHLIESYNAVVGNINYGSRFSLHWANSKPQVACRRTTKFYLCKLGSFVVKFVADITGIPRLHLTHAQAYTFILLMLQPTVLLVFIYFKFSNFGKRATWCYKAPPMIGSWEGSDTQTHFAYLAFAKHLKFKMFFWLKKNTIG